MKRVDLRKNIIPTVLENEDENYEMGNPEFNTEDLIYIERQEDYNEIPDNERSIEATDYAVMNQCEVAPSKYTIRKKNIATILLRSTSENSMCLHTINEDGTFGEKASYVSRCGICPALHYKLSENEKYDIQEIRDENGNIKDYVLQLGEYPKTKVGKELSGELESLYNDGNLLEEFEATGRWYSGKCYVTSTYHYIGRHIPEFEYRGERYARIITHPAYERIQYSDETFAGKIGDIKWVKVEPISFKIKNWDELPIYINPNGTGNAEYFDLRSEEAIISSIPFYPYVFKSDRMWQNSTIRGFLNGIDVRNIKENGNPKYGEGHGGDFSSECNFLNEAFYLDREPMKEYQIPESETEIQNDAFNGCVTLKKLIIHSKVDSIGMNAFSGLNFQYAYRLKNGNLILAEDYPKNEEIDGEVLDMDKMKRVINDFDYDFLPICNGFRDLNVVIEVVTKAKCKIPYIYLLALCEEAKLAIISNSCDFRYFKSEIPNFNELLSEKTQSEKIDFFKFAHALGCFSTQKIIDKNGKETEAILGQKASSLLAKFLKIDGMRLRKISWII